MTLQGSGSKIKGGLKVPQAKPMKKGMKDGGMMMKGKGKTGTGISSMCPEEYPGIQSTSTNNGFFGSNCDFGESWRRKHFVWSRILLRLRCEPRP
jgi:hypothetical protein